MSTVFVHMVLWNSARTHGYENIKKNIKSVIDQQNYKLGSNLNFLISDNASTDGVYEKLEQDFSSYAIQLKRLNCNFGFSGAHNVGAKIFIDSSAKYLLILNPDCYLTENFLTTITSELEATNYQWATPLLLRAGADMQPLEPPVIDAAGMILTNTLRHFDRGSAEFYSEDEYASSEAIFGGTGACLLLSRKFVELLTLPYLSRNIDQELIHPDLKHLPENRINLFDEAFFAYREDADIAWRAKNLGLECLYIPKAIAYHRRVVTNQNRSELNPEYNRYSVRNRFLLQINNYFLSDNPQAFLSGIVFRNLLVLLAVLFKERSSIAGLLDVYKLTRRAVQRRGWLKEFKNRSI